MMRSMAPTDFLTSLLDNIDIFSLTPTRLLFPPESPEIVQDSQFLNLPDVALKCIVDFMSLKDRVRTLLPVCKKLRETVRNSIIDVAIFSDGLDNLPDNNIKYFLSIYGRQIKSINFDLFRSTTVEECTQWNWRQMVISSVKFCPSIDHLNILVCNRHRLRDTDLQTIFRNCVLLKTLCVDAQYLNGHCFQYAPVNLTRLEMEMCYRFNEHALTLIFTRLRKLKVLHISQILCLKDNMIGGIVNNLKSLTELSIVSHQDSRYPDLTPTGLTSLGRLPRLRVLCLEGLATVTDRVLADLSDEKYATSRNLVSLSLAFCYNFSVQGVKCLARMKKLENVNLDGVKKRDISIGVETLAREGRLVRLMLAEKTNICPESLLQIVKDSPKLRLLDITNNEMVFNWHSVNSMVVSWVASGRPPLTILTNEHLPWNMVFKPKPDQYGRCPVNVVHLHRRFIDETEIQPESVLSDMATDQIPAGLLLPELRRGNRYRLLWENLGPTSTVKHEDHREGFFNSLTPSPPLVTEEATQNMRGVSRAVAPFEPTVPPPPLRNSSASSNSSAASQYNGRYANADIGKHSKQQPKARPPPIQIPATQPLDIDQDTENYMPNGGMDFMPREMYGNSDMPIYEHTASNRPLPPGFSYSSVSDAMNPHTQDWSLDTMTMLLTTHAFLDGARIGTMEYKEGLVFRPDGMVSDEDYQTAYAKMALEAIAPLASSTSIHEPPPAIIPSVAIDELTKGSSGAPRPPVEIPEQPVAKYKRAKRPARIIKRAQMLEAYRQQRIQAHQAQQPKFKESDFPPLGAA